MNFISHSYQIQLTLFCNAQSTNYELAHFTYKFTRKHVYNINYSLAST